MSVRNLDYLFHPRSVAVVGASVHPTSLGYLVVRNLQAAGFAGPILPVNPKYEAVAGILAYDDVGELPIAPDLAVICTPPATIPEIVGKLGERGTAAAVVLSAGLERVHDENGRTVAAAMLEAARPYNFRILGHNCLGLIVPRIGLNASFAHIGARPGDIAFVSQSGALGTAVLDWAHPRGIGFSCFLSLGNMADIDFGDVLDYLAADPNTRSILLYMESVDEARKFLSAARAAARHKHVIAIKSGRMAEGAEAAASHTGALAGADEVYEVAFRRAGVLRVFSVEELFEAVETLARARPVTGDRLAILTNGGGPGVLATDALVEGGGRLAELEPGTLERLDRMLPPIWSHGNPVDVIGDAGGERYAGALRVLLEDRNTDAVLVLNTPTAVASSTEVARAIADVAKDATRNVLTSWVGATNVQEGREIFARAGVPTYETPASAVRAFLHMVRYRRNHEQLLQTPASAPEEIVVDRDEALAVIDEVLTGGREMLTEVEAKRVLAAYDIPVVPTAIARSPDEARRTASSIGFPVALKILSHDISHKSDVGGVVLDLDSPEAVEEAARAMLARVAELRPDAGVDGFTVQPMVRRPGAHELILGAVTDPVFGPVLLFGQGGTAVEVIADKALALPPLNMSLARELMERTRVFRLLRGYRDRPAADIDAIAMTLLKLSQLIVDCGAIVELDINPLWGDDKGVIALDARVRVARYEGRSTDRLAIRPYPRELEETVVLESGDTVFVRPIRPEDEAAHLEFFSHLSPEDVRFRFFGIVRELPPTEIARYTQIDYDREIALIAVATEGKIRGKTLGVVRAMFDADNRRAEFAVIVRADMKGRGLGRALVEKLIRYCRKRGTQEIVGQVHPDNARMLALAESLGFALEKIDSEAIQVRLRL